LEACISPVHKWCFVMYNHIWSCIDLWWGELGDLKIQVTLSTLSI